MVVQRDRCLTSNQHRLPVRYYKNKEADALGKGPRLAVEPAVTMTSPQGAFIFGREPGGSSYC